jgi:hypothetical protein
MKVLINPNKVLWEKGDFTCLAATMRESAEALVQRLGIKQGIKVFSSNPRSTIYEACKTSLLAAGPENNIRMLLLGPVSCWRVKGFCK